MNIRSGGVVVPGRGDELVHTGDQITTGFAACSSGNDLGCGIDAGGRRRTSRGWGLLGGYSWLRV